MAGKIREIQQARPGVEHEKLLDLVVAEKKGPGEGKTTRSGDGRKRENRRDGTSKSKPGGPGKPSLGICASLLLPAKPNCSH